MSDDGPPLSSAEWDRLFTHERGVIRSLKATIDELRAELVAAHEEIAALKAGVFPEVPFVG